MGRIVKAADNFNRASLGTDWSQRNPAWGTVRITSSSWIDCNNGDGSSDHDPVAAWVGAGTFSNDQYASILVSNMSFGGSNNRIGAVCRAAAGIDGARSFYVYYVQDDAAGSPGNRTLSLIKVVIGTVTPLVSGAKSIGNGDRVELQCIGTAITGMINGVSTGHSVIDSSLASGQPGALAAQTGLHGDDWEAGDVISDVLLGQAIM